MGIFNFGFFGEQKHRTFHYTPRYYDPEEEARKQKFGDVDGTREREAAEGKYVPGSYLRGSFTSENGRYKSHTGKLHSLIGLVGLVLLAVAMVYFAKIYGPMRESMTEQQARQEKLEQEQEAARFENEDPEFTIGEITIID